MKKLFILGLMTLMVFGCQPKTVTNTTYDVTFEEDWVSDWCNPTLDPVITDSSIIFNPGRVVSTHGYRTYPKLLRQLIYQVWNQTVYKRTIG